MDVQGDITGNWSWPEQVFLNIHVVRAYAVRPELPIRPRGRVTVTQARNVPIARDDLAQTHAIRQIIRRRSAVELDVVALQLYELR